MLSEGRSRSTSHFLDISGVSERGYEHYEGWKRVAFQIGEKKKKKTQLCKTWAVWFERRLNNRWSLRTCRLLSREFQSVPAPEAVVRSPASSLCTSVILPHVQRVEHYAEVGERCLFFAQLHIALEGPQMNYLIYLKLQKLKSRLEYVCQELFMFS